jgi:glycosyltransferase involved in cell wall biosynthesis
MARHLVESRYDIDRFAAPLDGFFNSPGTRATEFRADATIAATGRTDHRMTTKPIRILYLTSSWPHGPAFGGQMRSLHVARALRQVGDVTVTVVSSDANDQESMRQTEAEFDINPPISPELTPRRSIGQRLRRAIDPRYLNIHGFAASAADTARVLSYLPDFDLVWMLNSRTPNLLQLWSWPHAHLDIDDVPSTYLGAVARTDVNWLQRCKARMQQRLLKRREFLFRKRFTTLSVCSEQDRTYLGGGRQIHVIPNGFVRPSAQAKRALSTAHPRIGFIGLFSYEPNADGVRWFVRECWPLIRARIPGIRLRLCGKGSIEAGFQPEPDVDVLGWVDDSAAEIATWSAMVIPIRFGGGTRVKIADAFSRKCPAVSTSFGAYGYAVHDGRELRLADNPQNFADACVSLVRDPDGGQAMAERAYQAFLANWTWDAIAPCVWAAAEDCLWRSGFRRSTTGFARAIAMS